VERQIVIIFAGTQGYLDKYPVNKLGEYERQLEAFIDKKYPEIYKDISTSGKLEDALKGKLQQALKEFENVFVA